MKIRYTISAILTMLGIVAILSPTINDWLIQSPPVSAAPEDLCEQYRLNLIAGENTCIRIVDSIQEEIKEKGIEGLREIPPAAICQGIDYDNEPKCFELVTRLLSILPF
ncbi:MAG: hypothetical protein WBL68_10390 [Nitrososphaeraceae archaeon]